MFAALSGKHREFFQKHLMRFVAIAPVVYLENIPSEVVKETANSKTRVEAIKMMGVEQFSDASMQNQTARRYFFGLVANTAEKILEKVSEKDISLVDKEGMENYF